VIATRGAYAKSELWLDVGRPIGLGLVGALGTVLKPFALSLAALVLTEV
jgi:hypothetical protein